MCVCGRYVRAAPQDGGWPEVWRRSTIDVCGDSLLRGHVAQHAKEAEQRQRRLALSAEQRAMLDARQAEEHAELARSNEVLGRIQEQENRKQQLREQQAGGQQDGGGMSG